MFSFLVRGVPCACIDGRLLSTFFCLVSCFLVSAGGCETRSGQPGVQEADQEVQAHGEHQGGGEPGLQGQRLGEGDQILGRGLSSRQDQQVVQLQVALQPRSCIR